MNSKGQNGLDTKNSNVVRGLLKIWELSQMIIEIGDIFNYAL